MKKRAATKKEPSRAARILSELKKSKVRLTKPRSATIEILGAARSPLAVNEILGSLEARGMSVNKTTVYRELESLMKRGTVTEVDFLDGRKRYELTSASHHHHLVCTRCRKIECVDLPDDLTQLEQKIMTSYGFKISSHILEFFGICASCSRISRR